MNLTDFIILNKEFVTLVFSVFISIIPVPLIAKWIIKKSEETTEYQKRQKGLNARRMENSVRNIDLESVLSSKVKENEGGGNTGVVTTSPQPRKYYYKVKYDKDIDVIQKNALGELYEKRRTDKFLKKVSFLIAVIMSILGTAILFAGIVVSFFVEKEVAWITTSSGAIVELVAGVYFWLVNRTMKEVKDNSVQLERKEDFITAVGLAEKISDTKTKDETYKSMIDNLLSKGNN